MWYLLEKVSFISHLLTVLLILAWGIYWVRMSPSYLSIISLIGALLLFTSVGLRLYLPEIESINLGYKKPVSDNDFVWMFYMYGFNVGLFIFFIGVFFNFIKNQRLNRPRTEIIKQ